MVAADNGLTARNVFFTPSGTLRAFWRLGVFCAAVTASWVVVDSVLGPVITGLYSLVGLQSVSTAGWIEVGALLGGHWIALRWVDKRPWSDVGLDLPDARPSTLARGFLVGSLAIGIPIVGLIAAGWLARTSGGSGTTDSGAEWLAATLHISAFLLPAAFAEELLARGYVFSVLRDASDWRWSLGATSIGFGLLHLQNNGATAVSLAMVMLAGVFLGLVRIATGSLYAAWMAHFAWNWTMAALFHTAVSGYPFEAPAYRYVDAGPNWATGGIWGPEASVPAGLSMLLVVGYLMTRQRRRQEN